MPDKMQSKVRENDNREKNRRERKEFGPANSEKVSNRCVSVRE